MPIIILCLIQTLLFSCGILEAHIPRGIPTRELAVGNKLAPTRIAPASPKPAPKAQESQKNIRVLLSEYPCDSFETLDFTLASSQGLSLRCPHNNETISAGDGKKIHVMYKKNSIYLVHDHGEKEKLSYLSLGITSENNIISVNGKRYHGNIILRKHNNSIMVINKLDIEDYIYSVIRSEIPPSWPLRMQELQSKISRSYAVSLMVEARSKGWVFDIRNTNLHQVYNGVHGFDHLRTAINNTRGEILMYHGNVARTMFDICCGGAIPENIRQRDKYCPYLFRKNKCTHCSKSKRYSWKLDLFMPTFLANLKKSNKKLASRLALLGKNITDIKVTDKDGAGMVYKLALFGSRNKKITISYAELNSSMPGKLKSRTFTVKKVRDRIVIAGNGWGHQRGLCQIGAEQMLRRKKSNGKYYTVNEVLSFYYPGTTFGHLL